MLSNFGIIEYEFLNIYVEKNGKVVDKHGDCMDDYDLGIVSVSFDLES